MGQALAERLLAGEFDVLGWDLSSGCREQLVTLGGKCAGSCGEVFAKCERVLLSLPTFEIGERVLQDAHELLSNGQTIIDTSTGAPPQAVALATALRAKGCDYLDATISGSSAQVRNGDVLVMVGGEATAVARCQDVFACFARDVAHTGKSGSGAKMKLVTNLVLGLNRAALAEGFALAEVLELEPNQVLQVLRASMAYSRIMDTKGEKMIAREFSPQAKLSQHFKDVRLMLAAAAEQGQELPLSQRHAELLVAAEKLGLGEQDNSAVLLAILAQRSESKSP
jgi:3-hydroxyisobutyrate dehydrogenase-like beta-hydroxyacid dehydrogenase